MDTFYWMWTRSNRRTLLLEKHNTHTTHTHSTQKTVKNDMVITCLFSTLLVGPGGVFFLTNEEKDLIWPQWGLVCGIPLKEYRLHVAWWTRVMSIISSSQRRSPGWSWAVGRNTFVEKYELGDTNYIYIYGQFYSDVKRPQLPQKVAEERKWDPHISGIIWWNIIIWPDIYIYIRIYTYSIPLTTLRTSEYIGVNLLHRSSKRFGIFSLRWKLIPTQTTGWSLS